jgi:oligopeptide transport system permease protein
MRTDNLNPKYASIPAEMFEPVNRDRVLSDQKIQTKPIGFLRDAFRRFVKNKGSVVAAVVIIFLLLFAIIAPFCTPYKMDEAFGYYKQTRPKVSFMNNTGTGFWDGTYVKDQPFQDYINYNAIAMGTMYDGVNDPEFDWDAVVNNEYNPIKKVLKEYTKTISLNGTETVQNRYEYRIDSYYEIGFVQVDGLTMDQYEDILA